MGRTAGALGAIAVLLALGAAASGQTVRSAGRGNVKGATTIKEGPSGTTKATSTPAPAAGPVRAAWAPKTTFESVHFSIGLDFDDEAYAEKLAGDLERHYSRLQKEFWDFVRPENREGHVWLVVFDATEAFDAYGAADVGVPPGEKGYSNKRTNRIVILRQIDPAKDLVIAVHELSHVFVRWSTTAGAPMWLDEGLAAYYANYAGGECGWVEAGADGVSRGLLYTIDEALKAGAFVSVGTLLRMNDAEFYGPASNLNYAEAWALVYYLRHGFGANSDRLFSEYYSAVARGEDGYAAFAGTYGANREFGNMWLAYLKGLYRGVNAAPATAEPVVPSARAIKENVESGGAPDGAK